MQPWAPSGPIDGRRSFVENDSGGCNRWTARANDIWHPVRGAMKIKTCPVVSGTRPPATFFDPSGIGETDSDLEVPPALLHDDEPRGRSSDLQLVDGSVLGAKTVEILLRIEGLTGGSLDQILWWILLALAVDVFLEPPKDWLEVSCGH